ncbi:hypothetical protein HQ865_00670 [Mucilaginibacter mali]|uniref:Uncharacterized protein n=1 Tax=Mucilaginibacter mali TaxID=2740462 RepID=A0A7D4QCM8_9SPHI|nr:hypothetical protein [Mucilaginibacter mali]QKJ28332.1 hypothetical protein HQ865_00670 [Mucilaginibacter mali]
MYNTYNIGSSREPILLSVFITSPVPARSTASITDPSNPTDWSAEVVRSNGESGDIISKPIGDPGSLKGKRLSVTTVMHIPGDDIETRKKAAECVGGGYLLERGVEGLKEFSNPCKTINDDATEVVLNIDAELE